MSGGSTLGDRFRALLLPGIVFQSVLVGGAYATGREIVQYGARFGAGGLWSLLAIGLGFGAVSAVAFEFARVTRCYDYRSLLRELIGPAWRVFDVVFVAMVVLIIAVVSAASGSIAESILGLPYAAGVTLVILLVGAINAAGRRTIENFKSIGTALLYAGYAAFAGTVLAAGGDRLGSAFAEPLPEGVTVAAMIGTGILYVGYNVAGIASCLFVLDRQTRRSEAMIAGALTGLLSTVPFLLTYLAVMVFYPEPAVLDAEVPWLVMLDRVGGGWLVAFYAVVVFWTLVETSVGFIHAVIDRIAVARSELGRPPLTPRTVALISAGMLILAALLSRFGIIALVARGYGLLAYAFLALFVLPLLTVGVWRIVRSGRA
jgi:uncharacterized membrane protein YkvI